MSSRGLSIPLPRIGNPPNSGSVLYEAEYQIGNWAPDIALMAVGGLGGIRVGMRAGTKVRAGVSRTTSVATKAWSRIGRAISEARANPERGSIMPRIRSRPKGTKFEAGQALPGSHRHRPARFF